MKSQLPIGKLPSEMLASLLASLPHADARVVVGPGIGQDAAVVDMGDRYLVAKTDPITFATAEIGWYAVNVNANDIACMGAHPKWFLASALLPENQADGEMARSIFSQTTEACAALNVSLIGGHTEITHGLTRPLVVGAMLGEVAKDALVTSRGARVGDSVLLTKALPLEGTALIAREKQEELRSRGVSDGFIQSAQRFLHEPGISIVREALIAADAHLATAMHDPTEGGLATGLWELAGASQVGLAIQADRIPFSKEGLELCAAYSLDPMGVLASGSLLLTAPAEKTGELVGRLEKANIPCAVIGRVVPLADGVTLLQDDQRRPLMRFERDEVTRLFG